MSSAPRRPHPLSVTALSLAACAGLPDETESISLREQAVQELQRQAGAPVALEVGETGDVRVLAMLPKFPIPGHAIDSVIIAKDFLVTHHDVFQLEAVDATQFIATRVDNDRTTGLRHVTLNRIYNGISVFQGGISVHMDPGNNVFRVLGDESYHIAPPTNQLLLSPSEAVVAAGRALKVGLAPVLTEVDGQHSVFTSVGALDPIQVDQKIFHVARSNDRFAYQATVSWVDDEKQQQYQLVLIDAQDGSLLANYSLVNTFTKFTGRVFTASPGAHPTFDTRVLVSFPTDPCSSPIGWVGPARKTIGNNAVACTDLNGNNVCGINETQPTADTNNSFDFPLDPRQDASFFKEAAVTSAFYLVNNFHDRTYGYGFTEAAGNFQTDNFGLGGLGNDEVQVDVQDGSGTNNANFATPPDGSKPRMQNFLFNIDNSPIGNGAGKEDGDFDPTVVYHENTHGLSNRLVGAGSTACLNGIQSGGMGEGWSDFMAASLVNAPVIGAYVTGNAMVGIRRASMANSPFTYGNIKDGTMTEVHDAGEIWAATLWDIRNSLGAAVANQLVVQGMKLTPCSPTMLQARDGIVAADQAINGGANRCALFTAFAGRKMGLSASSPNDNSTTAIVLATDTPLECSIFGGVVAAGIVTAGTSGGVTNSMTSNFTSTDVPKNIPDNNATGVRSVINVTSSVLDIGRVTVDVNISHKYRGDLVIQVLGPNPTTQTATLSNRQACPADNFITTGQDISGSFPPGSTASGQWQLFVRDLSAVDVGTINSFALHISPSDFSITSNPTSQTIIAGTSATYTINTAVLSGAMQNIMLSVTGLPAGVTGIFNQASVIAGGRSTLTLTADANTSAGTTPFTITGTGTSATHAINPSVTVNQPPMVTITSPLNGSTVGGVVTVSANASDADGVASVKFDLPDGTSVTTSGTFSTTWNSATVANGSYVIRATATDNWGATSAATVTITVHNCVNNTFSAQGLPIDIPDFPDTGITSLIPVSGNGTVGSLSLALSITHPFRGDLVVKLTSPGSTQYIVSNREGGSTSDIIFTTQPVTMFNGQTAAGTWQLEVQDGSPGLTGKLNSWSMTIVGNCP